MNPGEWNWQNYAGFFWGGSCFLCIIYTYFRVPEPAGRSFAELDLLFARGVSARKFATTNIDVFDEQTVHETVEGTGTLRNYEEKRGSIVHGDGRTMAPAASGIAFGAV